MAPSTELPFMGAKRKLV